MITMKFINERFLRGR